MIRKVAVTAVALLFAAIGMGFWFTPRAMGQRFHIDAVGAAGMETLRADLGGLFIGLALLCLIGAWKENMALRAALVVLASVVTGRMAAVLAGGMSDGTVPSLALEAAAMAAIGVAKRTPAKAAGSRAGIGRRIALGGGALVLALVSTLLLPGVQSWIFDRAAARLTATTNDAPLADDALRVAICGSSAPLASADRAKACVAIFAGGKYWLVDVGPESVENLVLWNIPLASIGGVLLTHFHSDHIGDLGELNLQTWAQGRPAPMAVYGGPGVEGVVDGFNAAYRLDQGYRTAHHTAEVMPPETWPMVAHTVELDGPETPAKSRTAVVLDEGGLRITAIEVEHAPIAPAYAYRFDYKGRSVVVTGDTKYHPPLATASKGADVLISEAIARSMVASMESGATGSGRDRVAHIMRDIQDYHISPEEAAQTANDAGVRLLVFYHLLPAPDQALTRRLFSRGVNDIRKGRWDLADDGSLYTLPFGSEEVRIGRIAP